MVGEENNESPFILDDLKYPYDAFKVLVNEETMHEHHKKHQAKYVKSLNEAVGKVKSLKGKTLEQLLTMNLPKVHRQAIINNAGGHLNHIMFFTNMSPNGGGVAIGDLGKLINKSFGSFKEFKNKMIEAGINHFGSGWVWLASKNNKLQIITTSNQDNPLSQGYSPIAGIDLWEHSYYLDYKSDRAKYLQNWWKVADWPTINNSYVAMIKDKR